MAFENVTELKYRLFQSEYTRKKVQYLYWSLK